ncbi:hypothetical protein [Halovulum dunhuangense]|uniref:hypothetical protein n=1 Tax=Halovulum dunhuangense TaxID=1505036 RepID=UPI001C0F1D35|nr:hypothetical protein [Halovulum dunhuangense]
MTHFDLRRILGPATFIALVLILTHAQRQNGPWVIALGVLLLSLPTAMFLTYRTTLGKLLRLAAWRSGTPLRGVLLKPYLGATLSFLVSIVGAFALLTALIGFGPLDLALIAISPAVFLPVRRWIAGRADGHLEPLYLPGYVLWSSAWITAAIMALAALALRLFFGEHEGNYASLAAAMEAGRAGAGLIGDSAIAGLVARWAGILNAVESFVMGSLGQFGSPGSVLALGIILARDFALFLALATLFAAFCLPLGEYRRILHRRTELDLPPPSAVGIAFVSAIGTVAVIAYLQVFALVDQAIRNSPWLSATTERAGRLVEQIDQAFYESGTIDQINAALGDAALDPQQMATLEQSLVSGFDAMERNIDGYLDWYYSLPAEYARTGHLLAGNLEEHLRSKLVEHLEAGDPFDETDRAFRGARSELDAVIDARIRAILDENRVMPDPDGDAVVTRRTSLAELETLAAESSVLSFGQRGAIAGATGAAVAAAVVAKAGTKGILKIAAKAAVKSATSKSVSTLGGAGMGAAAGAAAGSVVPVLGTAVGAAIGGVVGGLATAVAVDTGLLALEEAFARDDHRADLVAVLSEMEAEALANLRGFAQAR